MTSNSADRRKLYINMERNKLKSNETLDMDNLKEPFEGGIKKTNAKVIFLILAFLVLFLTLC